MADKNRERCKRRATEELLTRSIEHLAKLAVLDHRDDLKPLGVPPHQGNPRGRPPVILCEGVKTAAEIRSRPPAEQFGTLRGSTAGCLKSPDRLVARFGFRLQGEGEHEFHRAFPFSLRGSSLPGPPRAGTRLVARWMHPWRHQGTAARPRQRKWASRPGNIPTLKTFSRCGILAGGSKRCCLAFRLFRREADHSHHAEDGCEIAEKIRQDETREMTVLGTILLIILI